MTRIFHPEIVVEAQSVPWMLIVDGHQSHESLEFLTFCFTHNIYLLRLPAHTFYLTQPLDIRCFGPLKTRYRELVALTYGGEENRVNKNTFLTLYQDVHQRAFTKVNVEEAWRGSGLYPQNDLLLHQRCLGLIDFFQGIRSIPPLSKISLDPAPPPPAVSKTPKSNAEL